MSREFTKEELAAYNGADGKSVYLAVRGTVFDVSSGASFYGQGGPYEVFAGKECARALGLMKIDASECTDDLAGLTDKQLETLQDWVKKFTAKYPVVGKVAGSPSSSSAGNKLGSYGLWAAAAAAGLCAALWAFNMQQP